MIRTPLASCRWQFRNASQGRWDLASVPGCVHTDLLRAKKIPDPFFGLNEHKVQWVSEQTWEYRTYFDVTEDVLASEITELVSDGLDTVATVILNGVLVGATNNMFVGHRWSIRPLLQRRRNELRILFASATEYVRHQKNGFTPPREYCDPVGNAVRLRKQPSQFGWDWAPRLVTAGIWRDLRLESWTSNRLAHAHVTQKHHNGRVYLRIEAEFHRTPRKIAVTAICRFQGQEVTRAHSTASTLEFEIVQPRLWWPAGQGEQPLYDVTVVATDSAQHDLGTIELRLGLRTIVLDQRNDPWGTSFRFVVNGRPIFAKGANWIPAHSFVTTLNRERYARDLVAAQRAHMNCLRLWGGGIYESEDFYDLCDELGLMLWHDFMFSCALYPSDRDFLASVRAEAQHQVKRLHHRACLALWCGNNELAQLNRTYLQADPELMKGYEAVFHELLPKVVNAHDRTTAYWPSSEWRGSFEGGHAAGEIRGDSHFWDVWHARHPVKDYERWAFRFCSEFGMQSYSSEATNQTFCPPHDTNIFGPSMENHQKNAHGNLVILDYVSRRYRFPRTQKDLIYQSQLNQAYCVQIGVEHYRRLMPRCMGALYWQLNDCWPGSSWSSIEFTGEWKALHYAARRFNAPALVSAHVPADETIGIGNRPSSTLDEVHLYTVYDAPTKQAGLLRWDLIHLDGQLIESGRMKVTLIPGQSRKRKTLFLRSTAATHGRDRLYLRIALELDQVRVSEQTVFLTAPRFMPLEKAVVRTRVLMESASVATIRFTSRLFQHAVQFELPGLSYSAADNFFDLYPREPRTIRVEFSKPVSPADIGAVLRCHSLVDTYD